MSPNDLFMDERRRTLPPLHSQEDVQDPHGVRPVLCFGLDVVCHGGISGRRRFRLFGFAVGLEEEWGYFTLTDSLTFRRGPGSRSGAT
jgi:hypothetical protein